MLFATLLTLFCARTATSKRNLDDSLISVNSAIVNNGSRGDDYFNLNNINQFGDLKNVVGDSAQMKSFTRLASFVGDKASDDETTDLIKNFFWGKSNGIVLEMGAMDGSTFSQSKPLEDNLGWHRILVEGSPLHKAALTKNTLNAYAFSCAICDRVRQVHYVNEGGAVGGILEFMQPSFIAHFHKEVAATDSSRWSTIKNVEKVSCYPLSKLIALTNVHHINAFILDVEGGELAVLHSIKWQEVLFDVVVVETNPTARPPGYAKKVTAFLSDKGYQHMGNKGRNSWYKHFSFTPSVMPASK